MKASARSKAFRSAVFTPAANAFTKFFFQLINNMDIAHHTPGQSVITQNEAVIEEDTEQKEPQFLDDVLMFFIIGGRYKVTSLMFDMKKKRIDVLENGNGADSKS